MKIIFTGLMLLTLTGCGLTPQGDKIRSVIAGAADKTSEKTLTGTIDYLCKYARIGALKKRLTSPAHWKAYALVCNEATIPGGGA